MTELVAGSTSSPSSCWIAAGRPLSARVARRGRARPPIRPATRSRCGCRAEDPARGVRADAGPHRRAGSCRPARASASTPASRRGSRPAGLRPARRQAHGRRRGPRRGDRAAAPGARRGRGHGDPDDPAVPPRSSRRRRVPRPVTSRPTGSPSTGTGCRAAPRARRSTRAAGAAARALGDRPGGGHRPGRPCADDGATSPGRSRSGWTASGARGRRSTGGRGEPAGEARPGRPGARAGPSRPRRDEPRDIDPAAGDADGWIRRASAPATASPARPTPAPRSSRSSSTAGGSSSRSRTPHGRACASERPARPGQRGRRAAGDPCHHPRPGRVRRGRAGRRRRGRPAAARRGGDEDAERAPAPARRAPSTRVAVAPGQTVELGDLLVVLE